MMLSSFFEPSSWKRWGVLVLIAFASVAAIAQMDEIPNPEPVYNDTPGATYPDPPIQNSALATTAGVLAALHDSLFTPIGKFAKSLTGSGLILLWSLVMLQVIAGGVMLAAGSTDLFDLTIRAIKLSMVASLAYSALEPTAWLGAVTGIGGKVTLPDAILKGFYTLSELATPGLGWQGGDSGSSTSRLFSHTATVMFDAIMKFVEMPVFKTDGGFWRTTASLLNPANWVAIAYWLFSVLAFALACGMLLFELIGAELTIQFALAFTPLMVPWMLFRPMEFLFNSWLRMLLIGALGFVVTLLMVSGFSAFAIQAAKLVELGHSESFWDTASSARVMMPVFLGSIIFFMVGQKANTIASGLISGSGTDGISLHTLRNAMGAMNGAAKAPGQLAGHAANGARNVGGGVSNVAGGVRAIGKATSAAAGTTAASLKSNPPRPGIAGAMARGSAMAKGGVAGVASLGKAALQSLTGTKPTVAKSTLNSPGGKAVSRMAVVAGKDKQMSPKMFNAAAGHANKAFSIARGEGKSGAASKVAAQNAARDWIAGVGKNPRPQVSATGAQPGTPKPAGPRGNP